MCRNYGQLVGTTGKYTATTRQCTGPHKQAVEHLNSTCRGRYTPSQHYIEFSGCVEPQIATLAHSQSTGDSSSALSAHR